MSCSKPSNTSQTFIFDKSPFGESAKAIVLAFKEFIGSECQTTILDTPTFCYPLQFSVGGAESIVCTYNSDDHTWSMSLNQTIILTRSSTYNLIRHIFSRKDRETFSETSDKLAPNTAKAISKYDSLRSINCLKDGEVFILKESLRQNLIDYYDEMISAWLFRSVQIEMCDIFEKLNATVDTIDPDKTTNKTTNKTMHVTYREKKFRMDFDEGMWKVIQVAPQKGIMTFSFEHWNFTSKSIEKMLIF